MRNGKPGRACSVCIHPARAAIDAALISGQNHGSLSREHKLSPDAISRHARRHVSAAEANAAPAIVGEAGPVDVLTDMTALRSRLLKQMRKAELEHDTRACVLIARELCRVSEIIGRISGQLKPDGTLVQVGIQVGAGNFEAVRSRVLGKLAALAGGQTPLMIEGKAG